MTALAVGAPFAASQAATASNPPSNQVALPANTLSSPTFSSESTSTTGDRAAGFTLLAVGGLAMVTGAGVVGLKRRNAEPDSTFEVSAG
ncbi:LPXTG cell wall anchor domain-containing protein [Rarobacter incanus]|uniref:LPXTG cell wall anchor domain-containing protein n=1 Tax=Rarobacter incanus TaxID=153494 RepID=UPI001476D6AE|nr:LPXTG cell wall anchor domain-containing protein [Rarobacter incanus]